MESVVELTAAARAVTEEVVMVEREVAEDCVARMTAA